MVTFPQPPDWTGRALCAQVGADFWFPSSGESASPAKRICARCPVRTECRQLCLDSGSEAGIWGGEAAHRIQRGKNREAAA